MYSGSITPIPLSSFKQGDGGMGGGAGFESRPLTMSVSQKLIHGVYAEFIMP